MTKHIGIVACSAEGAALCYRTIVHDGARLLGPHAHPELSMHTHPLSDYVDCIERDDWDGVASLMLSSSHKLAKCGADFLVCPDNTVHQVMPAVLAGSPLPWLHIAAVVAQEAKARGYRRLGLLGTRWLVESEVYPEKLDALGLAHVRPGLAARMELNRIIMDELVAGELQSSSAVYFQQTIARLKSAGCDAVVLGCTEIPLLINERNSSLPILDSTRLLARAALRHAAAH